MALAGVECWFDRESGLYLNRAPDLAEARRAPERYGFRRLVPKDCVDLLTPPFAALLDAGLGGIVLAVSPVPLRTTFSGGACVTASAYAKSTLRVAAEQLAAAFPGRVDYFPAWEIAQSEGLAAFGEDQTRLRPEVAQRTAAHLRRVYG